MNKSKKLLILVPILTALTTYSVSAAAFSDVTDTVIYKKGIEFLQENGIVDGYPDGTFQPKRFLNRAEMLKIAIEGMFRYENRDAVAALEEYVDKKCFDDVPANEWYTKYVCYAKVKGWIQGYENGRLFKPAQSVNLVEAIKIALEVFSIEYEFTDEIWYQGLINAASLNKFLPHNVSGFYNGFTREQMADLIARIIKSNEGDLEEYLGDRSESVPTYDSIMQERNLAAERGEELNFDPEFSPVISVFFYTSKSDPHRVLTLIEIKEQDMDKEPATNEALKFAGISPDETAGDRSAFYYLSSADCEILDGCDPDLLDKKEEIKLEAKRIIETFSFENSEESGGGCFYISDFDFSMQFPENWGEIEELAMLDESHWGDMAVYMGNENVCSRFDDDYGGQYEQWRAEAAAEYDMGRCLATDFPSFMIGKEGVIYRHCLDLFRQAGE